MVAYRMVGRVASRRLPALSKSRNLEELDLYECAMELYEEDICMLAGLPLLQPVRVKGFGFTPRRLDLVRQRALELEARTSDFEISETWSWRNELWMESDLGKPPIIMGGRGI